MLSVVHGGLVAQKRPTFSVYPQKLNREAPHEDSKIVLEYKTFPLFFILLSKMSQKKEVFCSDYFMSFGVLGSLRDEFTDHIGMAGFTRKSGCGLQRLANSSWTTVQVSTVLLSEFPLKFFLT